MTANDIIRRALRQLAIGTRGETLNDEEYADGLESLNGLIGQWATQRLTMVVTARSTFPLTASQVSYTIGDGGDFDVARPVFLPRASVIQDGAQPLEIPLIILSTQQWQQWVSVKSVESALPTWLYYDYDVPLGRIYLWPIVNVADLELALYLPTAMTEFASGATDHDFAPGYADALVYNLAIRLAPEYGRPVPGEVMQLAADTLANIKRANIRIVELRCEPGLRSRRDGLWNWLTDSYIP